MKNRYHWLFSLFGKKKAVQAASAWINIFDIKNDDVKMVLQDLISYCNVNKSSFVKDDPHSTAFNEGARDVFLHICEMSNINMQEVIKIIENTNNN